VNRNKRLNKHSSHFDPFLIVHINECSVISRSLVLLLSAEFEYPPVSNSSFDFFGVVSVVPGVEDDAVPGEESFLNREINKPSRNEVSSMLFILSSSPAPPLAERLPLLFTKLHWSI
jgi:hypothetical protein